MSFVARTRLRVGGTTVVTTAGVALLGLTVLGFAAARSFTPVAASATVTLGDDAGGLPLFPGASALTPGVARSACIALGSSAAGPDDAVTFAAEDVTGALAPHITVDVVRGTGGVHGDCSAFVPGSVVFSGSLAALGAVPGDGLATGWYPGQDPVTSFRLTLGVEAAAGPRGAAAGAAFVWRLVEGAPPPPPPPSPTPTPTNSTPAPPTPTPPVPTSPTPTPPVPTPPVPTSPTPTPPVPTPPVPTPPDPTPPDPTPTGSTSPVPTSPDSTPARPTPPVPTLEPTPTVLPTASPSASSTVTPTPGVAGGGPRGGGGTSEPDVRLTSPIVTRAWRTLSAVIADPQYTLVPLAVALLFLLAQDRIDRRDPKLAAASRTRREQSLDFPRSYRQIMQENP